MRLVADEGVDRHIVQRLRTDGHSVLYIAESHPGMDDDSVLRAAMQEQGLLLTADLDFGEMVFLQHKTTSGVLLMRLQGLSPEDKADLIAATIAEHGSELLNAFSVVAPRGLRIRPQS